MPRRPRSRRGASEPAYAELRGALKRPLHTLKGGARMAGITAMGDLSHELETLVMQIDSGAVRRRRHSLRPDAGEPR